MKFPEVVRIESSAICNFNCIHCSNGQGHPTDRGVLSIDTYQRILNQFEEKDYVPRVLVLYHGGEPLINKDLPRMVKMARSFGIPRVKIVTNASLLSVEKTKELLNAGITDVDISFDGCSPVENENIRKNANWKRDYENALSFIKLGKGFGVKVKICNVQILTKEEISNKEFERPIPEYLLESFSDVINDIDIETYPAMIWPGFDIQISDFEIGGEYKGSIDYCENTFETISILSNGKIVPCCYDIKGKIILGDIYENDIFSIWNNSEQFRYDLIHGKPCEICRNCMMYTGQYLMSVESRSE